MIKGSEGEEGPTSLSPFFFLVWTERDSTSLSNWSTCMFSVSIVFWRRAGGRDHEWEDKALNWFIIQIGKPFISSLRYTHHNYINKYQFKEQLFSDILFLLSICFMGLSIQCLDFKNVEKHIYAINEKLSLHITVCPNTSPWF